MYLKRILFCGLTLVLIQLNAYAQNSGNYRFFGAIPYRVLCNYLNRSLQMYEYCKDDKYTQFKQVIPYRFDDRRMILNTGAKFIGRTIYCWDEEEKLTDTNFFHYARTRIQDLHKVDPDIIFQACIFEAVSAKVSNIIVPPWVLRAFGMARAKRGFRYKDIIYAKGYGANRWGKDTGIPDVSRLEARMWFYYLGKQYIDCGIEAIHWGQIDLMSETDKQNDYKGWKDILSKLRNYARTHTRHKMLLCDGHSESGGLVDKSGHLLFDFNSYPIRPKESGLQSARATVLQTGYSDSFYGRSKGGITPSGWACKSLPYLVELDSYGNTSHPGTSGPEQFSVWGYDEINWFAAEPESYRNIWLNYAFQRVRTLDANAYLIMPGAGPAGSFRANTKSVTCPVGGNAEETIKDLWMQDM